MYGLMRAGHCSRHRERAYNRRLHYCGTCKTMGRLYGQKSRLLLNNDAVFLGELLSALTPDVAPIRDWDRSFQSYNCFSLPAGSEEMPLALQVAATATLVMSEFKVADQLDDGGNGKWKLAQRIYSQSFCDASRRMKEWGFPLAAMWKRYQTQRPREAEVQAGSEPRGVIQALEYVAEPTATVTGWTFQHGAEVVGASGETQQTMYALGVAFGRLVYVLDALDDYQQDLKRGEFNALQAAFQLPHAPSPSEDHTASGERKGVELPEPCRTTTEAYLWELASGVVSAIEALPLPVELTGLFTSRLKTNLARRLNPAPAGCASAPSVLQRLFHAARHILRIPRLLPAHALPGGNPPVHLSEDEAPLEAGKPTSSAPVKSRSRGGGSGCVAGCDGCDCCTVACCDGGCECCAEGGCGACGECCGSCGACGECCGSCGSGCAL